MFLKTLALTAVTLSVSAVAALASPSEVAAQHSPVIDREAIAERCADPNSLYILCSQNTPIINETAAPQVAEPGSAVASNRAAEIRALVREAQETQNASVVLPLAAEYFQLNLGNVSEENRAWVWAAWAEGVNGNHRQQIAWLDNLLFLPDRGEEGNMNLIMDRIDAAYTLHLQEPDVFRFAPCEMIDTTMQYLFQLQQDDARVDRANEMSDLRIMFNQSCLARSITPEEVNESGYFLQSDRDAAMTILNMQKARRATSFTQDLN